MENQIQNPIIVPPPPIVTPPPPDHTAPAVASRGGRVTTWVALVIIAAIAATVGYLIWAKAHEAWPFDYDGPWNEVKSPSLLQREGRGEFADWKIYRSEEIGVELQYPKDWIVLDSSVGVEVTTKQEAGHNFYFYAGIDDNDSERNYKDDDMVTGKNIIFENLPAREYSYPDPNREKHIFVEYKGITYQISTWKIDLEPTVRQILSTFKFIDSQSGSAGKPSSDELCIQVITQARNPVTGEIREFPTPCDVPEGWTRI